MAMAVAVAVAMASERRRRHMLRQQPLDERDPAKLAGERARSLADFQVQCRRWLH